MKPVTAPSVKFTYEDFLHFPNDGKRHEIIDGDHYVTPSPNMKHQTVSLNLTGPRSDVSHHLRVTTALCACVSSWHRGVRLVPRNDTPGDRFWQLRKAFLETPSCFSTIGFENKFQSTFCGRDTCW